MAKGEQGVIPGTPDVDLARRYQRLQELQAEVDARQASLKQARSALKQALNQVRSDVALDRF